MLLSGGGHATLRGKVPVLSRALMGPTRSVAAVILGPPASDCDRERDTLASARGGECGKVELNMFGDPETEDEGEKVGNGEVERDLFGCSSTCELRVRLSVPIF